MLIVLLLILANAFYVAAEFAAVGVRRSRIRALAQDGNLLAKKLLPTLEDPRLLDKYVAACQIGITFSSLVLGAYGQAVYGKHLAELLTNWFAMGDTAAYSSSAFLILFTLTISQVVFGELVPKSLALQFPVQIAVYTVLPMNTSLVAFSRFIKVLNGSGNFLLKIFGFSGLKQHHIHSPEEIEMLIAESREGGVLEEDEHKRLERALRLSQKAVADLMVPRKEISAIDGDASIEQVLQNIISSPYTRLPVYKDSIDNVIGMVRTKDLVKQYALNQKINSIDSMLSTVTRVPETMTADRLLSVLRDNRTHQALVVDEHGSLSGLITLEDVLSEMFGEVVDEFKSKRYLRPKKLPDGRIRLSGRIRLDRMDKNIRFRSKSSAKTLSGFIIEKLGYFPKSSESVIIEGKKIFIESVKGHVIDSILITPPSAATRAKKGGNND